MSHTWIASALPECVHANTQQLLGFVVCQKLPRQIMPVGAISTGTNIAAFAVSSQRLLD